MDLARLFGARLGHLAYQRRENGQDNFAGGAVVAAARRRLIRWPRSGRGPSRRCLRRAATTLARAQRALGPWQARLLLLPAVQRCRLHAALAQIDRTPNPLERKGKAGSDRHRSVGGISTALAGKPCPHFAASAQALAPPGQRGVGHCASAPSAQRPPSAWPGGPGFRSAGWLR